MKKYIFSWLLLSCFSFTGVAQTKSTTVPTDTTVHTTSSTQSITARQDESRPVFRPSAYIVPATLMTTGLLTQGQFSRNVHDEVLKRYPNFQSPLDDYLQYSPSVAVLGLGAAGVKGRHAFGDQIVLTVLSNVVSQGVTQVLKYAVAYPRPAGGEHDSFPSGHATAAFTGATVLAHEYGSRSAWYTVAGYATATTVAGFRVIKNRHWLADVLFGAGVGIGSTELVYQLYPWLKHLVIHKKQTVMIPTYNGSWGGVCLISVF